MPALSNTSMMKRAIGGKCGCVNCSTASPDSKVATKKKRKKGK